MRYPVTPIRPDPGNRAITILRIFLWLMPAIFIPITAVLIGLFTDLLHSDNGIHLGIIGLMIATAAVGYFDQRLSLMQKKIAPPFDKKELVRWTIIFVLAQIIIAPMVCMVVIYGFCAVTGSL